MNDSDKKTFSSIKSAKSSNSRRSQSKSKLERKEIETEDISLSQLKLITNRGTI